MFYLVIGFYVNEVKRGFCGRGKFSVVHHLVIFNIQYVYFLSCIGGYHLRQDYNNSKTDPLLLRLVKSFSPNEAVNRMKELSLKQESSVPESDNIRHLSEEYALSSISIDDDDSAEDTKISNDDDHQITVFTPSNAVGGTIQCETLTNNARTNLLNEQDLIQFDIKSKVFTVRSLDQQVVHAVHMNDRKRFFRCSCPSIVQHCRHVLAAKVYQGSI
jgi:hypothetical protein